MFARTAALLLAAAISGATSGCAPDDGGFGSGSSAGAGSGRGTTCGGTTCDEDSVCCIACDGLPLCILADECPMLPCGGRADAGPWPGGDAGPDAGADASMRDAATAADAGTPPAPEGTRCTPTVAGTTGCAMGLVCCARTGIEGVCVARADCEGASGEPVPGDRGGG
jgi:hypothetical protein